jgi:hypothetical protein
MKTTLISSLALAGLLASGALLADDDCTDPVADWQPRETLRQQVEQEGWTVRRIKVDDGCYEVRGQDRQGNKLRASYAPASLQLRELEIKFRSDADTSGYLKNPRGNSGNPGSSGSPGK